MYEFWTEEKNPKKKIRKNPPKKKIRKKNPKIFQKKIFFLLFFGQNPEMEGKSRIYAKNRITKWRGSRILKSRNAGIPCICFHSIKWFSLQKNGKWSNGNTQNGHRDQPRSRLPGGWEFQAGNWIKKTRARHQRNAIRYQYQFSPSQTITNCNQN